MAARGQRGDARPKVAMIVASDVSLIFFRGQLRHLRAAGFDVTCISSRGPGQEIAIAEGASVHSVKIERKISPGRDLMALIRLWMLLRRLRPELANFGTPKGGLLGGVAALLAGVPHRVYTLHGLRLETVGGWQRHLLRFAEQITCACAHRVRAVSPSLKARAVELGITCADRIDVLGSGSANGVDTELFRPSAERRSAARELRVRLGIPLDAPVIGFVGRITRDKGVRELEQAFRRLGDRFPDLRLLMIGGVEGACLEDGRLVDRCRQNPHVVMLEPVMDLTAHYLAMDLLILPTYREGLPNVPLEGQAMGVPVITTNATGACDAVINGVTGAVVPVHDVTALTEAAARLLADPEEREQLGVAGRAWMQANFNCQEVWNLIEKDYRQMLAGGRLRQAGAEWRSAQPMEKRPRPSEERTFYLAFGKRGFDLVLSATLLLALLPVLALLSLVVRAALGSPVMFRQQRPGKNGRPFTLLKFRTMTNAMDGRGRSGSDAERLTRLGRLLRSTSLDELPELVNVLRGEMSVVGPRPLLMEYMQLYSKEQEQRHSVRPGITGWAQVNGRNRLSWRRRLELDVRYASQPTFLWDLRILAMTLKQAVLRQGINHEGHATMPRFRGAESD